MAQRRTWKAPALSASTTPISTMPSAIASGRSPLLVSRAMAVNSLASKLLQQYAGDQQALKIAADLARKAGKETSTYEPWLTLAQIQHKQGKSKDARKSALKARERAAGDDRILQYIDALIQEF